MREILFHGKSLDNGEWVEGYYLHLGPVALERAYIIPSYASALYTIEVDPTTVGQFTGLPDKNGKRIFEGDVIKAHTGRKFEVKFGQHEDEECLVESTGWFVSDSGGALSLGGDWSGHEVIGNIHDNPELLEVTPDE